MGALAGSIAVRRYRVLGAPPADFKESYEKNIRAHVLVPVDPSRNEDRSIGWCSLYDENNLDLDFAQFYFDDRILLSLRVDVLKPPAAQVKRLLQQRQRELEAQRHAPLTAGALRDLKAILVAELRQKTPPKTKSVDMVWELTTQRLYFFSQSKGMNETFVGLFAQTFNLPIDLEGPGFWAGQLAEAETALDSALKSARPTPELLQGFIGLRPGPRVLDEVELLGSTTSSAAAP
jgi:hypothetical protein